MKTKRRVKEACRGIVSLCKIHCIVCLFFFFVTHIHQVDHPSLSLFPPDKHLTLCLLLPVISRHFLNTLSLAFVILMTFFLTMGLLL